MQIIEFGRVTKIEIVSQLLKDQPNTFIYAVGIWLKKYKKH